MALTNSEIKKLRKEFVCVRLVQMGGVDLRLFHFNFDLSWTIFFINADFTIYGRYGTRTYGKDTESCVSVESLKRAMNGALELHKKHPAGKKALAGKRISRKKWKWTTPEAIPALKHKMRKGGAWKKPFPDNCVHCHNVSEAINMTYAMNKRPVPDTSIWPYPFPEAIGMKIEIEHGTKVESVEPRSSAAKAGVKDGDVIKTMRGQPILSLADMQWILHNSPDKVKLKVGVLRGSEEKALTIKLRGKWRRSAHTWGGLGRANMQPDASIMRVPNGEKKRIGLKKRKLAIKFKKVWGTTQKAGFRENDIIIKVGNMTKDLSSIEFLAYLRQNCVKKSNVKVTVVREDNKGKQRVHKMVLPLNVNFIKR